MINLFNSKINNRVFFTGGSGLLALNWALFLEGDCEIVLGLHSKSITPTFARTTKVANMNSFDLILAKIREISPSLVVNTVAITSIEFCEQNPRLAYDVNALFAKHIAMACNILQIPLIHISTDHIFSGLSSFMSEEHAPYPLNVYASTKLDAENFVIECCPQAIVVRTNFFGWGTSYRTSFTDHILNHFRKEISFSGFTDVYFTPLIISELAKAAHELLSLGASGLFHISSNNRISKYEFATLLAKLFNYSPSLVIPSELSTVNPQVQRPKDMSLSNTKATRLLKRPLVSIEKSLSILKHQASLLKYCELSSL